MSRLILHIGMPKTGTSSIQETLFSLGELGLVSYAKLGVANHGGIIASVFEEDSHAWRGHRVAGRSKKEIEQFNDQALIRLKKVCEDRGQQIISGEGIWHMSEASLVKLRDFFSDHFDRIEVVGYVRSPASFIASAFQQLVKNHGLARLRAGTYYPHYRDKFEKFDRVFGVENVALRLFDPKQLAKGDVVVDFCQHLGESIKLESILRVNESISLEATAVLFAYRREGPQYGSYRGKGRDNNALVASLVGFGTSKLRLSNTLIEPVLERHRDDIEWIERRLNHTITDQGASLDADAISSEAQLLDIAMQNFDAFKSYVSQQVDNIEPTPDQLAHWVEKLRIELTGRNSSGIKPAQGSQGFFTAEQMELLEDVSLAPVVALRELAQSFRQQGLIREASSVIEAAIALRPDAAGLRKLQERIDAKL